MKFIGKRSPVQGDTCLGIPQINTENQFRTCAGGGGRGSRCRGTGERTLLLACTWRGAMKGTCWPAFASHPGPSLGKEEEGEGEKELKYAVFCDQGG